jgi:hypothetical protein
MSAIILIARELLLCIVNIDLLQHHPLGGRTAANLLMLCSVWFHYRDNAATDMEVP